MERFGAGRVPIHSSPDAILRIQKIIYLVQLLRILKNLIKFEYKIVLMPE